MNQAPVFVWKFKTYYYFKIAFIQTQILASKKKYNIKNRNKIIKKMKNQKKNHIQPVGFNIKVLFIMQRPKREKRDLSPALI